MRLCMHMNSDTIQNLKTHHRNKIAYCKLNLADTYSCSNYFFMQFVSRNERAIWFTTALASKACDTL